MRRTWGTCRLLGDGRGVIRLNTHLVKAPPRCLDFVIGHELCHLQEMNHGPDFYRLQEAICPDWRDLRDELRERGHHYTQE
jgi:predicted metal-dependent hydrolase